jgi:hypothetical protein
MNLDHTAIRALLDGYVDEELATGERDEVILHLAGCDDCAAEVEALLILRTRTRELPREIAPARDLWPEIQARLQAAAPARVEGVIDLASRRRVAPRWWGGAGLAAAVLALVVISSGVTAYFLRGTPDTQPQRVALAPVTAGTTARPVTSVPSAAGDPVEPTRSADRTVVRPTPADDNVRLASARPDPRDLAAFREGTGGFDGAVEQLGATFESQRDKLSPETVRIIEQNLAIIDRAIAESRAALEKDPNDPELPLLLSGVYRQKVELLQSAVQLQARS